MELSLILGLHPWSSFDIKDNYLEDLAAESGFKMIGCYDDRSELLAILASLP